MYAKGSNLDDDKTFEDNATMFGKSLHRDNRSKEELMKEAIEIAQQADVIVFAGERQQKCLVKVQVDLI